MYLKNENEKISKINYSISLEIIVQQLNVLSTDIVQGPVLKVVKQNVESSFGLDVFNLIILRQRKSFPLPQNIYLQVVSYSNNNIERN